MEQVDFAWLAAMARTALYLVVLVAAVRARSALAAVLMAATITLANTRALEAPAPIPALVACLVALLLARLVLRYLDLTKDDK